MIRNKKMIALLTVMVVTGSLMAISYGASDYVKKPMIGEEVHTVIDNNQKTVLKPASKISSEVDAVGKFVNKNASASKKVSVNGKNIIVKYQDSQNLKKTPFGKRADSYGSYDVYTDEKGTQYTYLANSDKLCGMKLSSVYGISGSKERIPENKALSAAKDYLKGVLPNIGNYKYEGITYKEKESIYEVKYRLKINGINTDDEIIVWVMNDGTIGAFSAFYNDRYSKIVVPAYEKEKLRKEVIVQANEYMLSVDKNSISQTKTKIIDEWLTIDDNGNLCMAYDVSFIINNKSQSNYVDTFYKVIK